MTALYHLKHRFQVPATAIDLLRRACSRSESFSSVEKVRHRIHTFRGVPGSKIDVLLLDGAYGVEVGRTHCLSREHDHHRPVMLIADIGQKAGRFDGAIRWRITIRDLLPTSKSDMDPPMGRIQLEDDDPAQLAVIAIWADGGFWANSFARLRYLVDGRTDIRGILLKHWRNYFHFIPIDDAQALASAWSIEPSVMADTDINSLNRSADRALYRLACDLGWVKLTLAQRRRLGLGDSSPCWHPQDRVQALRIQAGLAPMGIRQGVGEYTLSAAAGEAMPPGVCPLCEQLVEDCECTD